MNNSEEMIEAAFEKINFLADRHELMKARKECEEVFRDYPEHPRVLQGMGLLLFRTGEQEEGERLINRAIEIKPDYADAYHNLGNIKRFLLKDEEAERLYRQAIALAPEHFKALSALAVVLNRQLKCMEAIQFCDKALEINPRHEHAFEVMGSVMANIGRSREGIRYLKKSISLRKNDAAHSSLLFNMNVPPDADQETIFNESTRWGRLYCTPLTRKARPHLNSPIPCRRLRIGYVSGDFRQHPVAFHLKPVLANHDKGQVEIYLYNNFPTTDEMTAELASNADIYRDISSLPDEKVEEIIRNDGIDILVDLSGHTSYHRLHSFARKPAPVQASWIGYFNTTGVTAIDYLFSDSNTIPPGEDHLYVEKVVRLPGCRFCYAPPAYAPEVSPLPSIQRGYVTFGSFNKIAKTNDEVIALWSAVLNSVPESRMLLKWRLLQDQELADELKSRFAKHGIGEERLIFRKDNPHPEMLAEYGDVDIALDTFPYNGGATTCEALWMGVPVVTLGGRTPIGRQSMAFLKTIGCDEWVATTKEEYVKIAVSLASDKSTLRSIRGSLRTRVAESDLCDGKRFTVNLEEVYRRIWEDWCRDAEQREISFSHLRRFSTNELYGAGVHCMADDDYPRASHLFEYVLKREPDHTKAGNNLGISLYMMGDIRGAIRAFRKAIRRDREFADAYSNLGRVFLEMGENGKAITICRRAVAINPDHIDAHIHLSNALRNVGRMSEASCHLEHVLQMEPDNVRVLRLLSTIRQRCGEIPEAIGLLERGLVIAPDDPEVISALMMIMQYDDGTKQEELFKYGRRYCELIERVFPCSEFSLPHCTTREHLKVGLVSADFCHHPVGTLLSALFRGVDRERISLYCYNNGRRRDSLTEWYNARAAGWHDIYASKDSEVVDLIRKDGIDILIDLSGHTDGNRLPLFNLRPAPLQASWMGFAHTTGLSSMDYFIADSDMIREEDEQWFTERVVRLPHSRFCFIPLPNCPEVVETPFEFNGHITFGCFNNVAKVSSQVIACWAKILQEVPRSRLIMKWKSLRDLRVRDRFRKAFANYGISQKRLEFRQDSNPYFMMLEYGDVDIALDPFPFPGGMTSLNALWMGVPVISKFDALPISRQTMSFLRLVGLPELAVDTEDKYISLAAGLAADPERLKRNRMNLRNMMLRSPICDEKGYAESVQNLLFSIWREKADT